MPVSNKALKDLYRLLGEMRKNTRNGNIVDEKNIRFVQEAIKRENDKLAAKERK